MSLGGSRTNTLAAFGSASLWSLPAPREVVLSGGKVRWEDERYVRLYTRNTGTWIAIGWEGRFVLMSLLRQVDRAGVLDVLEGEESAVLAEMLMAPSVVVGPGLDRLISRGVVVVGGGQLRLPRFMEAQECRTSDKERQRKSRELAALGHTPSHAVTPGHTPSQPVTPSRAVPSRVVPKETSVEQARPVEVEVFKHWRVVMDKPRAIFDDKRRRAVRARLAEGRSVADLKQAIDGCRLTPHNMGTNDRGQKFDDLELICRNGPNVERFMANATTPPKAPTVFDRDKADGADVVDWAEEKRKTDAINERQRAWRELPKQWHEET